MRLRIPTTDIDASTSAWLDAGFRYAGESGNVPHVAGVVLTDGQIVVELVDGPPGMPTLVYGNASPARTAQQCKDRGAPGTSTAEGVLLQGLGSLSIVLQAMPTDAGLHPDGDQNPVLGFYDHMVVHVADLDAAKRWSEAAGLLVLDQHGGEHPSIEVTDGAATISLRTLPMQGIPLEYSADIDDEVVLYLQDTFGEACHVVRDHNDQPLIVRLLMPEGTMLMVGRDE